MMHSRGLRTDEKYYQGSRDLEVSPNRMPGIGHDEQRG